METRALLTTYSLIAQVFMDVSESIEGHNLVPVPGRTVFLDLNHDRKLDPGDPSGVTGADGSFTFTGLAQGLYDVGTAYYPGDYNTSGPGAWVATNINVPKSIIPGMNDTPVVGFTYQPITSVQPLTPTVDPIQFIQYGNGTSNAGNLAATEIGGLYNLILGRSGSPADIQLWATQRITGTRLVQITTDFLNSPEYLSSTVASYYTNYLGRAGTSSEIASWVTLMQHGMSEEQVVSGFLNSTEYNTLHSAPDDFVQSLYNNVLGRQASAGEVSFWVQRMNAGASRPSTVAGILDSTESLTRAVTGDYTTFLAREPSAAEVNAWLPLLALNGGPLTFEEVAADIAGSLEYENRAATYLMV